MTYLQTQYFLHVAETKSITKTSADLYVSPPAISKQIMLLEEELGLKLFYRGSRGMELTPAGEIMYNHFSNQKTAFDSAYTKAKSVSAENVNVLHLGVLAKWHLWDEFHQIRQYMKDSPCHADVEFHSCFNPGGDSKLEKGELDAVICLANDILIYAQSHELKFREIARIPKVFLYSVDSPVARKPGLEPADFRDLPLLTLSSKVAIDAHQNNMNLCHRLGLQPNVIFKDTLEDVLMAVGMNEGFFICDSWLNPLKLPDMRHL
ncbi:MAG: LysR family transcriptional regulator, partial [Parasporobacterium sp.]|nr:LysR family transcriptional regulator [Parasporobacterium sp.]